MRERIRGKLQEALGSDYAVGDHIGSGGFADVFRARDLSLKRDVAVKVLRPELAEASEARARFRREAEACARLRHPHIAPVYAVGDRLGLAYLIMPLLTGETLQSCLDREGRLPVREARRILLEAARALHAAHRAGIVHRDIKPDNIMLDGEDRRTLLMDFGIAKAGEAGGPDLTAAGVILGTPAYMSPEQAAGDEDIDYRTDIYSLGMVAYRMLTGALPFAAKSMRELLLMKMTEQPPAIRSLRPDCPDRLAEVVNRCLARDVVARWESAAALVAVLERDSPYYPARATDWERVAGSGEERSEPAALRAFKRNLLLYVAVNAVAITSDLLLNGTVDFAPVVLALSSLVLASLYSRLWIAGHSWRDVLPFKPARASRRKSASRYDSGARDSALDQSTAESRILQGAQAERAVIVGILAAIPRARSDTVAGVVPAVDSVVSRISRLLDRLQTMDRAIARARARLATEARDSAMHQRDLLALRDQEAGRVATEQRLEQCALAIHELRLRLERAAGTGTRESSEDIMRQVARLDALARD